MRRWATRCAWRSSTTSPSPTGRRSSCAIGSASSRTCWPTTSTCSSGSAWSSGPAPAATAAAATCSLRRRGPRRPGAGPARSRSGEALFVCTANSARSQLAAAVWREATGPPGRLGRHPSRRRGRPRRGGRRPAARPRPRSAPGPARSTRWPRCRRWSSPSATGPTRSSAPGPDWLHWSIPDPVPDGARRRLRRRGRRAAPADRHPPRRSAGRMTTDPHRPTRTSRCPTTGSTPPTASSPSRSRPAPVPSASTWPAGWPPRPSAPAC